MNILDNIVSWAPSILHFKGLGMRNLQYEMSICQKSHSKLTKTVYVWSEFLWIRRYVLDDFSSSLLLTNLFNYDLGIVYFWGDT